MQCCLCKAGMRNVRTTCAHSDVRLDPTAKFAELAWHLSYPPSFLSLSRKGVQIDKNTNYCQTCTVQHMYQCLQPGTI